MFHVRTIKGRMIWYNLCTISVIAVILSVSSYVTASKKAAEVAANSLNYHVESLADSYQNAYDEMVNIILNCTERGPFDLKRVGSMGTLQQRRAGLEYAELADNYCAVTSYGSYIQQLSIFSDQGVMVQSGGVHSSVDDWQRIFEASWFEAEAEKTMDRYFLELRAPVFFGEREPMLPIIHPITGTGGHQWAAVFLSPALFQDELEQNDNGNEIIAATYDGKRVASLREQEENRQENDELLAELLASGEESGMINRTVHGKESCLAWQISSKSGIIVMEVLDLEVLTQDRMLLFRTVMVIFVACLIIGVFLSALFGQQLQRPIDRLVGHIGRIAEGDFSQNPEIESGDEIGSVGKVVNDMSGQIEALMNQRLEDEKEKSSLELKMLQAQINPHFLYNTLDSIKWIAVIQKNSGIVKAVTALSRLLKNMAKGFHEKVTVEKELEFVKDYVTIEKLKYAELFDVQIQIDEEMLNKAMVVKLTLQPLIENAIFRGIEPSGKSGTILIHIFADEESLYLVVRDDGVGIPEEKMGGLLADSERLKGDRMSSIGMANVDRRIKLTYGEDYGLSIDSQVGKYTEITVKVPLEFEAYQEE